MLCAVIRGPTFEEVCTQITQSLEDCDLIELRLDLWDTIDEKQIKKILSDYPIPQIITLRSQAHGGQSSLLPQERLSLLQRLSHLQPAYLDVEYPQDIELLFKLQQSSLLLSYHNTQNTPADLKALYQQMKQYPAALYKMAVAANSTSDALHLLNWAAHAKQADCIAISMGPLGAISRILSPLIHNPFTYASLTEEPESILGQLSAKQLKTLYRFSELSAETPLYALIGNPVTTSISQITHNTYFRQHHCNALYLKIPTSSTDLKMLLDTAKDMPFQGFSITMPFKEEIIPYLDALDTEAKQIGAVNTLVKKEGRWIGYNTDGKGALNALEKLGPMQNKRCLILGAGGAAKAIAYEAQQRGCSVCILSRRVEQAEDIAKRLSLEAKSISDMKACYERGYDMLINCTPIDLPIDPQYLIPHSIVMDIRSKPLMTPLLQAALTKKCKIVPGYHMFVEQALLQFTLWGLNRGPALLFTVAHQILTQ